MDPLLQRFLDGVRRRARRCHLATYEDLVVALQEHLGPRRRAVASMTARDFRRFMNACYLRNRGSASAHGMRRFCAASRVLVRWLAATTAAPRHLSLARESAQVARATVRAARACELLETMPTRATARVSEIVEDYFEVVARGSAHVALRPLSLSETPHAALIGPVAVPAPLAAVLDPGALVNLQLGRSQDRWSILSYGFCYPSTARSELCDAIASEAP